MISFFGLRKILQVIENKRRLFCENALFNGYAIPVHSVCHLANEPGLLKTENKRVSIIQKSIAMKKVSIILFLSVLILSSLAFTIISSKQSSAVKEKATQKLKKEAKHNDRAVFENWSVDQYGVLIFPNVTDVDEFMELLQGMTHSEAQEYLHGLEFESRGANLYTGGYLNEAVSYDQTLDYVLNSDNVANIHGLLFKPISETECEEVKWEFMLVMKETYLTSTTYGYLASGTFDDNTMNKFATNPAEPLEDLQTFVISNPYGYEDTEASECPESPEGTARFWGWGPETCVVDHVETNPSTGLPYNVYKRCQKHHIFWIVDEKDCYLAYGCAGCPAHGPCNE